MRALQVLIAASVLWHAGCARLSDRRAAYLAKGKAYLEQRDGARAVLEYRNAVRLDPKDAEAHYQLGMAYLMAKAVPQAFAEFSQTVQLKPSHTQAHVRMAELMIATDDQELRDAASGRMQWLLQQSPGDSDTLTAMAFAELKSGKPREAERDLMRAVEHAPAAVKPAGLLAGVRLANGDTAGAEKILKETVGSNPRSQEAAVALGRFYVLTGREGEAEGQFRRALELDPKNGMALIDLGAVQMRAGRKSEAEESYRRASASGSRELRATHALYLIGEKRLDAAVAELRGLVRKDPEDRHARTLLVDALLAAKQREAAVEVLSRALAANGRDVDALLQRARIEIAEGEFGEAERELRSVLSLDNGSAAGHLLLARVQLGRENWDGYRRELEETLRRDGYILQARVELADTLIAKRGFAAALDLLNATPDRQKGDLGVTVRRNRALMKQAPGTKPKGAFARTSRGRGRMNCWLRRRGYECTGRIPRARGRS